MRGLNPALGWGLVAWHEADPVDEAAWARHEYVAGLQGGGARGRNPFVVDPTLVCSTFLPGIVTDEPGTESPTAPLSVYPNPASTLATVRIAALSGALIPITGFDALGRLVWSGTTTCTLTLPVAMWASSAYAVRASGASARLTVTRRGGAP